MTTPAAIGVEARMSRSPLLPAFWTVKKTPPVFAPGGVARANGWSMRSASTWYTCVHSAGDGDSSAQQIKKRTRLHDRGDDLPARSGAGTAQRGRGLGPKPN